VSEYGRAGLVGVLPPQSNRTVEAELGVLLEPDVATVVSRLVCRDESARERLLGYFSNVPAALASFDTLQPKVTLFACTGSTYLVGLEAEDRVFPARNVVSAARAVLAALDALEIERMAIVSPYPAWLTEACAAFWASRGRRLVDVHPLEGERDDTRRIYALTSKDAAAALTRIRTAGAQAVLLTGTGMPTLAALAGANPALPVLSSNFCLGWVAMRRLCDAPLDRASLLAWLSPNADWRSRLAARFPSALENSNR